MDKKRRYIIMDHEETFGTDKYEFSAALDLETCEICGTQGAKQGGFCTLC
jgi:hypothetical protein